MVKRRSVFGALGGALVPLTDMDRTRELMRDYFLPVVGLETDLQPAEYVATVPASVGEVEESLEAIEYVPNGLAATKHHPETGATDDASLRRVDAEHPLYQYHVHLFERPKGVDIYLHYEPRPDPVPLGAESWGDVPDRLVGHFERNDIYKSSSGRASPMKSVDWVYLISVSHDELDEVVEELS